MQLLTETLRNGQIELTEAILEASIQCDCGDTNIIEFLNVAHRRSEEFEQDIIDSCSTELTEAKAELRETDDALTLCEAEVLELKAKLKALTPNKPE